MHRPTVVLVAAALLAAAGTSRAQPREPLPRVAADVRVASLGLPTTEGWTPAVPVGTQVPARTAGFDAGAHVYVARFGGGAVGVGATVLAGRGTTAPAEADAQALPTVATRLWLVAPHASINFGHRLGWSYVSGGLGRARLESEASSIAGTGAGAIVTREGVTALHYGGGARWFISDRLGIGFDLRWYRLRSQEATSAVGRAPRTSLMAAAVGISLQ